MNTLSFDTLSTFFYYTSVLLQKQKFEFMTFTFNRVFLHCSIATFT